MGFKPFFRTTCKQVAAAGFSFYEGVEYQSANFSEPVIAKIARVVVTKGIEPVPAIEFYNESQTVTVKAESKKVEKEKE